MLVVLLVLAAGGFVTGMRKALVASGNQNNTILLGVGSEESLERSEVSMRTAGVVAASLDGILEKAGVEAISPEIHLAMPVSLDEETDAEGQGELMLVGILTADGGVIEGEIWYPLSDLQVLSQRDAVSCVIVTRDGATPPQLAAFASRRLDLELAAIEEVEYFASLSKFYAPIQSMVLLTALLVGIGAIIGGLNSNYATFVSRIREMGTLQTLGYSRFAITISLLQESILASAIGSLLACLLAIVLLDGAAIRFSMGVFGLHIDTGVLAGGLLAGLLLGIVGALLPAWRCLTQSIPEALKTTI